MKFQKFIQGFWKFIRGAVKYAYNFEELLEVFDILRGYARSDAIYQGSTGIYRDFMLLNLFVQ